MSITTFADLISQPATKKIQLAEILAGERLDIKSWTQHGVYANAWYISDYYHESITLTNGAVDKIIKSINSMKFDGTALTVQASISDVSTNSNSYWHDTANKVLYVNVGGDPTSAGVVVGYFYLYFSSHGVVFNDRYYEPYIVHAPGINQGTKNILSGFSQISAGNIRFNNGNGYFDKIIQLFIWENRTIVVKYGGESLPYSEYETVFVGIIDEKTWSEDSITFNVRSNQIKLLRSLPEDVFDITTYPNLDPNAEGQPIPIAYGDFDEQRAPIIVAIDEAVATDQVQYRISGHDNFSIDNAYVNYSAESGWETLSLDAGLGSANTYKVDSAANQTITVRHSSGGYVNGTTKVKVAFKGRKDGANQMTSTADIVQDLLVTYNDFTASDLDTTAFADSKTESDVTVAIYINKIERTDTIIDKTCSSDLAYFYEDKTGKLVYKVWSPIIDPAANIVDQTDLLDFKIRFDSKEHFGKIKVGYSQSIIDSNYKFVSTSDNDTGYIYGVTKQKLILTYLTNKSHAEILRDRLMLLRRTPVVEASIKTKWQLSQKNIGDKLKITATRAPDRSNAAYTQRLFEIISISKDFDNGLIAIKCDDLKGIGEFVGTWTADSAPDWSAATEEEKAQNGFWCNSNGYADPSDLESKNRSIWW